MNAGYLIDTGIECLCKRWEDTNRILNQKENRLTVVKSEYDKKEFKILYENNINFKEVYGKNNDDVRKHHVRSTLKDLYNEKKSLELEILKLKRDVSLLKALVYVKIEEVR